MELGILIPAMKNMESTLLVFEECIRKIHPDYIWVPDRLYEHSISRIEKFMDKDYTETPVEFLDPFITISAFSSRTCGVNYGIAVTDFIRRLPADLIRASHTISQILESPINMGFGAGELINLSNFGYKMQKRPVSYLEEQLKNFKILNDTGIHFSSKSGGINLGYSSSPSKIWIGGQRSRMLDITAKYADGWIPAWKMTANDYREKVGNLAKLSKEYNRPVPKIGMFAEVFLAESKESVFDFFTNSPLKKQIALQASADLWHKWNINHPAGSHTRGLFDVMIDDIPDDILLDAILSVPSEFINDLAFVGSIQDVLNELIPYLNAGMEHLALALPVGYDSNGIVLDKSFPAFLKLCEKIKSWQPNHRNS